MLLPRLSTAAIIPLPYAMSPRGCTSGEEGEEEEEEEEEEFT